MTNNEVFKIAELMRTRLNYKSAAKFAQEWNQMHFGWYMRVEMLPGNTWRFLLEEV